MTFDAGRRSLIGATRQAASRVPEHDAHAAVSGGVCSTASDSDSAPASIPTRAASRARQRTDY